MPSAPTDGANPGADASALRSWLGEPGRAGLLRFAGAPLAEQITWLMPLAFFAAVAVLIRSSASSERIATWIWAGWLVTYWGVLSFAKGIFHNYYSVVMGPAIAALVGIGLPALWRAVRSSTPQRLLLPVALLVTGVWQAHVLGNHGQLSGKFIPFVIGGTALAAVALLAGRALAKWSPQISWEELGLELGLFAVLLAPATWSVTTVLWPGSGMFPAANADIITRAATKQQMKLLRNDLPAESVTKLVDFLSQRQSGVDYLLATLRSDEVAPIIVHSGAPVIAFGGFRGADQIFSKDAFIELVRSGRLRYVLVGATEPDAATHDSAPPATNAADSVLGQNREIVEWVRERGSLVEPSLWKLEGSHVTKDGWIPGFGPLGRAAQLFDLQSAITIPNNQTEGSSRRES
jgi:4-amino-4-deoxy-L-arabinose transferase-like glycosyltransferase